MTQTCKAYKDKIVTSEKNLSLRVFFFFKYMNSDSDYRKVSMSCRSLNHIRSFTSPDELRIAY